MQTRYNISEYLNRIYIITFLIGLSSCQQVINVDLNSASPKIVIDGSISDQSGPYTVTLSQTVNYDQDNTFPPVTGAIVVISDDAGNVDTLKEVTAGTYQTSKLQGVQNRTYTLSVTSNGENYSATSTMPESVFIYNIVVASGSVSNDLSLLVSFFDTKDVDNYYHIFEEITRVQSASRDTTLHTLGTTISDRLSDGKEIIFSLSSDPHQLKEGDTVLVSLQCVDKNVYNYFRTALQNGSTSTSLSNPVTNLSNGALGYFSAYAVRFKKIVIPKTASTDSISN